MYATPLCFFCMRARRILKRRRVAFREINVAWDPAAREEMARRSGGARTVPQVFVDGRHIGDSDRLAALDESGALDALLGRAP